LQAACFRPTSPQGQMRIMAVGGNSPAGPLGPLNTELHTEKATHDTAAYNSKTHPNLDYLVIIVSVRLSEAPSS
jgi:hypothetical protein